MQTRDQKEVHIPMQTRDQKYAVDAYDKVEKVLLELSQIERDRYGSMAHKLPILIRTAGLAQSLEFVNARGKAGHKRLLNDLALTVIQQNTEALLSKVRNVELRDYIYLTHQLVAALLWYKRFAQSLLDVEPGGKGDDE